MPAGRIISPDFPVSVRCHLGSSYPVGQIVRRLKTGGRGISPVFLQELKFCHISEHLLRQDIYLILASLPHAPSQLDDLPGCCGMVGAEHERG
eukprot:scaffold1401_cov330-Pavlova_lutheri.AAC.5